MRRQIGARYNDFPRALRLPWVDFSRQNAAPMKDGKVPTLATETPLNWSEVKKLFGKVLEFEPALRRSWLEENCQNNPALVREVESLLEHDFSQDRFLETPAFDLKDQLAIEDHCEADCFTGEPVPAIGNWRIVR